MKNILLVILGSLIAVGAFWGWNEYQAKQAELERTQLRNELFTQIDDVIERNDEYFSYLNKQIQLLVRPCDGIRNYERYKACAEGAQSEAHARANNRFGFTRNDLSRDCENHSRAKEYGHDEHRNKAETRFSRRRASLGGQCRAG
jgi:hypothetical protein